jgi:hypothetical protein
VVAPGQAQGPSLRVSSRLTTLCLAALIVICFSHCSSLRRDADIPLTRLSGSLDPLRDAFNKDAGKVRMILLLDPT